MPKTQRTRPANAEQGRVRLRSARAYLDVADLVLVERERVEMPGVAAALAVLAGIAASDALCARRLGQIHRGDDHRAAGALLRQATPDGARLASTLLRLIDLKDEAHYGVLLMVPRRARDAVRWAQILVDRAAEEWER